MKEHSQLLLALKNNREALHNAMIQVRVCGEDVILLSGQEQFGILKTSCKAVFDTDNTCYLSLLPFFLSF